MYIRVFKGSDRGEKRTFVSAGAILSHKIKKLGDHR